jgi:hypothetical protein
LGINFWLKGDYSTLYVRYGARPGSPSILSSGYEVTPWRWGDRFSYTSLNPGLCYEEINKGKLRFGDTAVIQGPAYGVLHLKQALLREPGNSQASLTPPPGKSQPVGAIAAVDPLRKISLDGKRIDLRPGCGSIFFTAGGTRDLSEGVRLLVKGGSHWWFKVPSTRRHRCISTPMISTMRIYPDRSIPP